jgi:hypothetical protein
MSASCKHTTIMLKRHLILGRPLKCSANMLCFVLLVLLVATGKIFAIKVDTSIDSGWLPAL